MTTLENRVEVAIIRGQDSRDGEAMRALIEAPAWGAEAYVATYDVQDDIWEVSVQGWTRARGDGKTLAEAADACRAALGPGRQPTNAPGSEGP